MKIANTLSKSSFSNKPGNFFTWCIFIICISLFLSIGKTKAQSILPIKKQSLKFGLNAYSAFTGSGIGTFYNLGVYVAKKRNLFSAGITVNKTNASISGINANYECTVMGDNFEYNSDNYYENIDIFAFSSAFYRPFCTLTKQMLAMENNKGSDFRKTLENTKIKTIEGYFGFGVRIKISKCIKWVNCVGFGGYYSCNRPMGLISGDKSQTSLIFKTGLSFRFN
jgi:hypothetical protein